MLSCVDRIRMLVEAYVTGFEKLYELVAINQRVETSGPADKNIFA